MAAVLCTVVLYYAYSYYNNEIEKGRENVMGYGVWRRKRDTWSMGPANEYSIFMVVG